MTYMNANALLYSLKEHISERRTLFRSLTNQYRSICIENDRLTHPYFSVFVETNTIYVSNLIATCSV